MIGDEQTKNFDEILIEHEDVLGDENEVKVEVKEETKSPTPEAAKTDVQIYQEKLIRLERHFSEKVKKLQSKISEFIPEILKTQLDDLLLKFHNEISEEFQKLKNPISGDIAPPATPTPTTPSPKLVETATIAAEVPILTAPTLVCPTIQAAPIIQQILPTASAINASQQKVVIPPPQVEKIIVNGQETNVVVQPNAVLVPKDTKVLSVPKDAKVVEPVMATLIRKRDPKGGGKITKISNAKVAQVKVVPIRKSARIPKPKADTEEETRGEISTPEGTNPEPPKLDLPPEESTFEVDYDYWTYERVNKEYDRVSKLADDDDFDCLICRRSFSTKAYLKSHLRAHRAPLKCKICKAEFRLQTKLEKHELTHRSDDKQMCEVAGCGEIFDTKKQLNEHKKKHKPKWACNICGKLLATEKSRDEHKVTFHLGGSSHKCDTCGKAFSNRSTLNRHKLLHSVEFRKPYPCNICKRAFIDLKTLKNHEKTCAKHFFSVIKVDK